MSEEWKDGYQKGFDDGYDKAKRDLHRSPINPVNEKPYNLLWSSAMTASVIKDPGPSDGMSYEEIYGSVVYQQNNKKEE
jgi:hypothetical protein